MNDANPKMSGANQCPQCGTPLKSNALGGLCPACLLAQGAADTVTDAKPSSFNPPSIAELAPLFPQLEILELIGKGGMGAVYKARQKELDRIVALKILPPRIGEAAGFADRFTREAKALAKLNHPNIVTLYEFGRVDGLFFFLMEFVDGVNLRQLLSGERISAREALAIVPQICDALQFAHDHGIVHRDIKPENILMDRRGRVKVADFGLAKIVGNDGRAELPLGQAAQQHRPTTELTEAGKVMGTPQYMAPEQKEKPLEVDHRADIYALGVVFYQMLTGELPGKPLQPPSSKVQIDVRLDEIVLRALEKKPELRYQQASALKTQVETVVETSASVKSQTDQSQSFFDRFDKRDKEYFAAGFAGFAGFTGLLGKVYDEPLFYLLFLLLVPFGFWIPVILRALEKTASPKNDFSFDQSKKPEIKPRFSRTAIVGTCGMMPLFFIAFVWLLSAKVEGKAREPIWWDVLLTNVISLTCFTAPLGITILGWLAVSQIRRSSGKIYGMWLAVFDGLLFPLVLLDVFIAGSGLFVIRALSTQQIYRAHSGEPLPPGWAHYWWIGLATLLLILLIDLFIIGFIWRAVNKPIAPTVQKPDRFWRWFAVVVLSIIVIPLLVSLVGLLAAIAIPNFVKARAKAQEKNFTPEYIIAATSEKYKSLASFRANAVELTEMRYDDDPKVHLINGQCSIQMARPYYLLFIQGEKNSTNAIKDVVWSNDDGAFQTAYFGVEKLKNHKDTQVENVQYALDWKNPKPLVSELFFDIQYNWLSRLTNLVLEPEAKIDDDDCFVISAGKTMVWIRKKDFLLKQKREENNGIAAPPPTSINPTNPPGLRMLPSPTLRLAPTVSSSAVVNPPVDPFGMRAIPTRTLRQYPAPAPTLSPLPPQSIITPQPTSPAAASRTFSLRRTQTFHQIVVNEPLQKENFSHASIPLLSDRNDPKARRNLAQALMLSGKNEQALEEFMWCWDHGKEDKDFRSTRISFLLSDISKFGTKYPPAFDALRKCRDAIEEKLLNGKEGSDEIDDLFYLNSNLKDSERTVALFDRMPTNSPVCQKLSGRIIGQLIEANRYEDILAFLDPEKALEQAMVSRQRDIEMQQRISMPPSSDEYSRKRFRESGSQFFEILAGAKQTDRARKMADKILESDSAPDTQALLEKAAVHAGNQELVDYLQSKKEPIQK